MTSILLILAIFTSAEARQEQARASQEQVQQMSAEDEIAQLERENGDLDVYLALAENRLGVDREGQVVRTPLGLYVSLEKHGDMRFHQIGAGSGLAMMVSGWIISNFSKTWGRVIAGTGLGLMTYKGIASKGVSNKIEDRVIKKYGSLDSLNLENERERDALHRKLEDLRDKRRQNELRIRDIKYFHNL